MGKKRLQAFASQHCTLKPFTQNLRFLINIKHRILNPILSLKYLKIFVFWQNTDIYSDSIWAKSAFVVTKW